MHKKPLKRWLFGEFSLKRLIRSAILIYAFLCFYGYFFTDRMIFQPQPATYQDSPELLKLNSEGIKISALYLPNQQASYTLLFSHGNAEDLGNIRWLMQEWHAMGFAVFAYDYRGYGTSQGNPTEIGAYQDINAAYQYLTQKLKISPAQIIVYGRSVGSGPSVDLASREPVAGLILESPFLTAFRVVTHIPIVPFDKFANLHKIKKVQCPVLIMHGSVDQVIPFWHGQQLFAAANQPKQAFWVEGADHNDVMEVAGPRYTQALQKFVKLVRGAREPGRNNN